MAKGSIKITGSLYDPLLDETTVEWEIPEESLKGKKAAQSSRVMKRAWRRARRAAAKFGGKPSEYIHSTMKTAWKSEKRLSVKTKKSGKTVKKGSGPLSMDTLRMDMLAAVFKEAQRYGELENTTGAALESSNGTNFLEFLEDLREEIGDAEIIANIKAAGMSIDEVVEWAEELCRAHYDDRYAKWAGGTEAFKDELRKFSIVLTGTADNELLEMFF